MIALTAFTPPRIHLHPRILLFNVTHSRASMRVRLAYVCGVHVHMCICGLKEQRRVPTPDAAVEVITAFAAMYLFTPPSVRLRLPPSSYLHTISTYHLMSIGGSRWVSRFGFLLSAYPIGYPLIYTPISLTAGCGAPTVLGRLQIGSLWWVWHLLPLSALEQPTRILFVTGLCVCASIAPPHPLSLFLARGASLSLT